MSDNFTGKNAAGTTITLGAHDASGVYYVQHNVVDPTGAYTLPTMDAAARAGYVTVTNGTQNLPTMDAAARAGFVKVTDGTNTQPTGDAVARRVYVQHTDGTNSTPAADALARPIFVKLSDGSAALAPAAAALADATANPTTTLIAAPSLCFNGTTWDRERTGSLAALQAYLTIGVPLSMGPGEQVATDKILTGTVSPDAALTAPGASKIYVVRSITITLAATSNQAPLLFQLTQDLGGTPVVLWQGTLAALANTSAGISLTGLSIPQTVANKTLDLKVSNGTIVSTNYIAVTFTASIAA